VRWGLARGLHSFRLQLNLSSSVHRVTQLNHECVLELLNLSSNVNECKPLGLASIICPAVPCRSGRRPRARCTRRCRACTFRGCRTRCDWRTSRVRPLHWRTKSASPPPCLPRRRRPPRRRPSGTRGLHSSTFRLNLSALYGKRDARTRGGHRGCVARVGWGVEGCLGCVGCFLVETRLKLS